MVKKKYTDLSKNALLFTISSFGAKLISFLLVPLYTYVLSTGDYGKIDLISTTVLLLIPIMTLNIQDAVLRFSLDDDYQAEQVIGVGIKIVGWSSVILGILLFLLDKIGVFSMEKQYFYFLFLSYLSGTLNNCFSMYLKAKDRVKVLVICGLINTVLTCFFNILLLLVFKLGVTGYLISNVLGTLIAVVGMFFMGNIANEINFNANNRLLKKMVLYSLPLVANSLAWWMNNASDRYILTFFCGTAINGIYAVAYKIPTILSTIQNIFYNAWSVSAITEFDKDDSDGFMGNVYMTYSCASFISCSLMMVLNIFMAKILYSKEFFTAWHYVSPLLVGTVFNGIALFEGCIFTAVKRTKDVSITTIIGAIVNTIFNFILIKWIGALGAALATMIGYITVWLVRTYGVKKIVKMKVNWRSQIISSSLIIIQCFLSLNEKTYWLQLPIFLLIIFSQRKYFGKVVRLFSSKLLSK